MWGFDGRHARMRQDKCRLCLVTGPIGRRACRIFCSLAIKHESIFLQNTRETSPGRTHRSLFIGDAISTPKQRHLTDFFYWRDRIAEFHTVSQSYPTNWRLMWRDRRNPLQWHTFWFAVAVLVFTVVFWIITSVTACLITKYTWQTLELARDAASSPPTCLCPKWCGH